MGPRSAAPVAPFSLNTRLIALALYTIIIARGAWLYYCAWGLALKDHGKGRTRQGSRWPLTKRGSGEGIAPTQTF